MEEEYIHKEKPVNTYFFISLPEPAMNAILEHTVEKDLINAALLWDGSYLLKLPVNATIPPILTSHTPYTHSEMKIEKAIREQGRPEIP